MSLKYLLIVLVLFCSACGSDKHSKTGKTVDTPTNQAPDKLQALYLMINSEMSYDSIIDLVKLSTLPYSEVIHAKRKSVTVAFEKEVTPERYAKSGDHLEVTFEIDEDTELFRYMTYHNSDKFYSLIELLRGSYYELHGERDAGLYVNDFQRTGKGSLKYVRCSSKLEQMRLLFNYQRPE